MDSPNLQKNYHSPDIFSWIFLFLLIGGSAYYIYSTRPCAQPVTYSLGTFNTQFGISQSTFLADAQEAADLWNQAAGHTVLEYAATGTVPINLLYDSRQQQTIIGQSIQNQESNLAVQKSAIDAMQSQYNSMEATFMADKAAHKDIGTLNSEITALNALAQQINTDGNALNISFSFSY